MDVKFGSLIAEPFTRHPIHSIGLSRSLDNMSNGLSHVLDKKSNELDRDPSAR